MKSCFASRAKSRNSRLRVACNRRPNILAGLDCDNGAGATYALLLKGRLLGENPCNVEKVFRKIRHLLASPGKLVESVAWRCPLGPCRQSIQCSGLPDAGGMYRDKVRCYANTTESDDPVVYGGRLKKRMDEGLTCLKMHLGVDLVQDEPGAITRPLGMNPTRGTAAIEHPFTGVEITQKGCDLMAEDVSVIRNKVGMEIPLSSDHFGHIGVNPCIRLGKRLTEFNLAWLEDMVPSQRPELLKQISSDVDIPLYR